MPYLELSSGMTSSAHTSLPGPPSGCQGCCSSTCCAPLPPESRSMDSRNPLAYRTTSCGPPWDQDIEGQATKRIISVQLVSLWGSNLESMP
ncbi:rCG27788, isoform CRA_a [Rattus norvegicus]|uniref:RCG27788, isoform CRA_a n=1 Tax=Rattus norvegicus TaxID=10116 RepID=A6KBJ7_RAT|nr:rCG27788, isoform CRA_a [Rattus norvegicus]